MTPQRVAMIEAIYEAGHITLEELAARLKETQQLVSQATLYNNLRELTEANLLRVIALPKAKVHYELAFIQQSHHHFLCQSCGALVDLPQDSLTVSFSSQLNHFGKLDPYIIVMGLCPHCQQTTPLKETA
ncbi:MAG: transcriptional repressor [Campylobacterales bacterium]